MKTSPKKKSGASAEKLRSPAQSTVTRILVPTDFSEASGKAISYACEWSKTNRAKITLLHVIQPITNPDMSVYSLLVPDAKLKQQIRVRLTSMAEEHGIATNLLAGVEVREGIPFDQITRAATQLKADVIVICTHGYTGFKRVVLGSTTERVVRHARCPVLVIPAKS